MKSLKYSMPRPHVSCIGSLNLDVSAPVPDGLPTYERRRVLTSFDVSCGGTAFNFAQISMQLGCRTSAVLVVGDDAVGEMVLDAARVAAPEFNMVGLRVEHTATGVVLLFNVDATDQYPSARMEMASERSAIDAVSASSLRSAVAQVVSSADIVFVDGYIIQENLDAARALLGDLASRDIITAIDLVPHDIWSVVTLSRLGELLGDNTWLSTEMDTLAKILKLHPWPIVTEKLHLKLANRLASAVSSDDGLTASCISARYRFDGREFALRMSPNIPPAVVEYSYEGIELRKSVGDRLFAEELIGVSYDRVLNLWELAPRPAKD